MLWLLEKPFLLLLCSSHHTISRTWSAGKGEKDSTKIIRGMQATAVEVFSLEKKAIGVWDSLGQLVDHWEKWVAGLDVTQQSSSYEDSGLRQLP